MSPLDDLLGLPMADLSRRLGEARSSRVIAGERWQTYGYPLGVLRLRLGREPEAVASWSLSLDLGKPTLQAAVEPLGLWPAAGPDVAAESLKIPLVRRALTCGNGELCSLTALARGGLFATVAVFDEVPDWL